jgi:hypothetical protein
MGLAQILTFTSLGEFEKLAKERKLYIRSYISSYQVIKNFLNERFNLFSLTFDFAQLAKQLEKKTEYTIIKRSLKDACFVILMQFIFVTLCFLNLFSSLSKKELSDISYSVIKESDIQNLQHLYEKVQKEAFKCIAEIESEYKEYLK